MCNSFVPLACPFYHPCLIWSADGCYFQPISFQRSSSTTRATISPPVTRVGAWSSSNEINRSVGGSLMMLDPSCDYYSSLTSRSASPMTLPCLVWPASLPPGQPHPYITANIPNNTYCTHIPQKKGCEYKFYTEFQSHEPEFDYLKSLEIEEKINQIKWCPRQNAAHFILSTNGSHVFQAFLYKYSPARCGLR